MGKVKYWIINFLQIFKLYVISFFFFIFILEIRGTPFYFSPEVFKIFNERMIEGNYNPYSNDVYDLGIICLELLLG